MGTPIERFREDGLRTMRAVRFCATLAFALEPETEAAIPEALDVLDRVSRERVRVELFKLLSAERPSLGLHPMESTGMWSHVVGDPGQEARAAAIAAVDVMSADPVARLARLLWPLRDRQEEVVRSIDGLKPSREDRSRVLSLTSDAVVALRLAKTGAEIRRAVADLGPDHLADAIAVLDLDPKDRARVILACANAVLRPGDMAIKGRDLIDLGIAQPGPALGELLDALFAFVIDDPSRNDAEELAAEARKLSSSDG